MRCTLMSCEQPATHALLVVVNGHLQAFARCELDGRAQVKARMIERVHADGRAALVRLPQELLVAVVSNGHVPLRGPRRDLEPPPAEGAGS